MCLNLSKVYFYCYICRSCSWCRFYRLCPASLWSVHKTAFMPAVTCSIWHNMWRALPHSDTLTTQQAHDISCLCHGAADRGLWDFIHFPFFPHPVSRMQMSQPFNEKSCHLPHIMRSARHVSIPYCNTLLCTSQHSLTRQLINTTHKCTAQHTILVEVMVG
jgi:hypothetical protein